ncbi:MAG TPA: proton-conducting transporter membrane subunit [Kofleriaceae bacterium]|nr:proton-conducting transporter membrane subunit [Kofleriaceae bacterium]
MIDELDLSSWLVVAGVALSLASGLISLSSPRRAAALLVIGCGAAIAGSVLAIAGWTSELDAPWDVPGGRLRVGVDALSAMFVLPIALVSALGSIYAVEYWADGAGARKLRAFYGVLTAGLLLLVVSRNGILFLFAWELMAVAAFITITTEDDRAEVRDVGYVYLLATRIGTLCLFATFALLAAGSNGSLDFDTWRPALHGPLRDAIFVTALVGFGLKAGMMPLHVWLPGAHANAPSHVSAQMSGVMIKVGIYGVARITSLCDQPPVWWGITLVVIGVVSGVLGVGFAIGQHDLKRLLAYHSVENIGIIALGLGVALLGRALGRDDLVVLGMAGALLHVWNHGLFKSLLFFSAGSVVHATGTREIDRLGGLWRKMPKTGFGFLVGAVAICGLPPLNGLISELFVYLGLFRATSGTPGTVWLVAMLAAASLALVGALALACFVKAFGSVFLGAPRSPDGADAHDPGRTMLAPIFVLAALCAAIGVGAPLVAPALDAAIASWAGPRVAPLDVYAPLLTLAAVSGGLLVVLAMWIKYAARPAKQDVPTWDCGYAAPSARMQYTSSSFADMVVRLFAWALRPTRHAPHFTEPFPQHASFESHVPDTVLDRGVRPVFGVIGRAVGRLRPFQGGRLHVYLVYILATLLVLLLWR